MKYKLVLLLLIFPVNLAFTQTDDPGLLSLERIFSEREFTPERFGPARWLDDGSGYTTLERTASDDTSRGIVRYDTETGEREVMVPAQKLIPAGDTIPLYIDDYEWSPDKRYLLIFTNTKRVWRYNTRGDYWIVDLDNWEMHQLGGDAEPSTLMFATFSPDGKKVAYVIKNNLYVEDLTNRTVKQLTHDGSITIINGTFDWVYEEEFGLRNGFRWSPDSERIAYWQLDAEGVGEFYMINNTDSVYSQIIPLQYPKVGTTNSAVRVGVIPADGGETTWFDVPGDPRNIYIARMDWAGNSEELTLQHLNRLQNTLQIMIGDASTGNVRSVYTEQDEAWIDVGDDMHWLRDGEQFTWLSEKDGWRHLYLISRDGQETLVTPGDYDVISIEKIDEKGGWVYFIASPDNPTQRYLFRVPLDGSGQKQRLTPSEQPGTHRYQMSPDAAWAFHTYSSFDTPPGVALVRLPDHKSIRTLVSNSELRQKVSALKRKPVEFFRIGIAKDVELDAWFMRPHDFDPDQKYPLLFFVYGEPAGQTVLDRWGGSRYLWHTMLTQQGYLVMSVDNRGTPAPRGRDWRKIIYRQIGILASKDQAAAAKQILKTRSYVDSTRIGIWGWSGGGSMTLNMLFRYPDMYHTGMSVAPVSNQRFYDTIYQERYMGLPKDNPEGFREGSPITYAHQLRGNLLLVHGTGDDNVHYQSSEALINELIEHNKIFSLMIYPNRTHAIREGVNTSRHLYETLTWFLKTNLTAGPASETNSVHIN